MDNNLENIINPFTAIWTAIVGVVAFFTGKKKENVEVKGSELDNVDKAVKIWQDLAETMTLKVEKLTEQVELLTKENQELRSTISRLEDKLDKFDEGRKAKTVKPKEPVK
jgi:predicted RNase H-like nuclease (RuvC/YqgF family)